MIDSIANSRILITGGSGFIGTNLISYLALDNRNNDIISLDIKPPRDEKQAGYWREVDLLDGKLLAHTIHEFDPDYIFHMAARTDLHGSTIQDYQVNTNGVSNLIDAIDGLNRLKVIIFASSRLVCRIGYSPKSEEDYCPTTAYGESKVEGERVVRRLDSKIPCLWVIVRPTSIWGPWFDIPYRNFFDAVRVGVYIHPLRTSILKSFGFVGNSVYQIERIAIASEPSVNKKTFYLCDYPPIEIGKFANCIARAFDRYRPFRVPLIMLRSLALIGDFLQKLGIKEPPLTSFRLSNLQAEMIHETSDLQRICGDLPYQLEDGVQTTVNWMKE